MKMFAMLSESFILCLTIAVVAGHYGCHDIVWKDEESITKCCRSIFEFDFDKIESSHLSGKCAQDPNEDECEIIKCVLREEGAMIGDKINAPALVALTMNGKPNPVWEKIVTDAVKVCMEKMNGQKHPEDYFLDCLDIMTFSNCPRTEWTEHETCGALNKSLNACL